MHKHTSCLRRFRLALLLPLLLGAGLSVTATPTAQARHIWDCLGVQPVVTPTHDYLPTTEVLSITVTDNCGEAVSSVSLAITDHIRCGTTSPWVVDYQNTVPLQNMNVGQSQTWWITAYQTNCPPGENGPWQQWLYGAASGTGSDGAAVDGYGNGCVNTGSSCP